MATNNCYFSLGNVTPKDLTQVKGHLACKGSMKTAVVKIKNRQLCKEPPSPFQLAFGYSQLSCFSDLHLLPVSLSSPALHLAGCVKAWKALMLSAVAFETVLWTD